MNNPFLQDYVSFDEPTHIYRIKSTGDKLVSATQLIGNYSEKFDPFGHILRACAKRDGITPQQLKKQWDDKRDLSCVRGHDWHSNIEKYLLTGKIPKCQDTDIIKWVKKNIKFEGKVYPEVLAFNLDYKICGMADIIEYFPETNEIICKDWKSNAKITREGYKGKKMLYPLNHLDDCSLSKYELQISLYSFLLELQGFKVKSGSCIFWINPESRLIETIPVRYLRDDVISMISHHLDDAF